MRRISVPIGRARGLYLPVGNRAAHAYCVRFFTSARWQHIALRFDLMLARCAEWLHPSAHADLGARRYHPHEFVSLLQSLPLTGYPHVGVRVGTAGPYQKISLLALSEDGSRKRFFKIAAGASADDSIGNESMWLGRLAHIRSLSSDVPSLIAVGRLSTGRGVLGSDDCHEVWENALIHAPA